MSQRKKAAAKRKRAMPAKRTSTPAGKQKPAVLVREPVPESSVGHFWKQLVKPRMPVNIVHNMRILVAIMNVGPATVLASTGFEGDKKLVPGVLKVLRVVGNLTLETMDDACATVVMQFLWQG
jgi:hypothetical protein